MTRPRRAHRAAQLVFFGILTAVSGCLTTSTVLKATASVAVLASTGYRALDKIDAEKQNAIRERAKTDEPGARSDFQTWTTIYNTARKALDVTEDLIETVMRAIPTLDKSGIAKWLPALAQAAVDLTKALSDAGVKIGGP